MSETMIEDEVSEPEPVEPDETPGLEPDEEEQEAEEEQAPPEPELEPLPEPETKADRELQKKLAQAATTYRNRVSTLLGEQAQVLIPCEICSDGILGAHFPPEWMESENDVQERILEVLRAPAAPEYQPDPNVRTCGVCLGLGKTATGSKVAGKTTRTCPHCKGYGYEPPSGPGMNGHVDTADLADDLEEAAGPLAQGDKDNWGTQRYLNDGQENPNYGKQPAYWDMSLPHGGV
jgi:hypothetical protein